MAPYPGSVPCPVESCPDLNERGPWCFFHSWIWYRYGLDPHEHERMVRGQDGKCPICGRKEKLQVDGGTGSVRGLLCGECCSGLGHFGQDPERLLVAARYLERDEVLVEIGVLLPAETGSHGRRGIDECEVEGCNNPVLNRGWCSSHGMIWYIHRVDPNEYSRLLREQNDECAICGQEGDTAGRRLAVDHCHITGRVRGLLCSKCNVGIGLFRDNPQACIRAAEYLQVA